MARDELTKEQQDFANMMAMGIHTGFRKAVDSKISAQIWQLIGEMPDEEWANVIDFTVRGLIASGYQIKLERSNE